MVYTKKNRQMVLLTLFAMTLVVIGHSDITPDFKNLWIYKWVYSFHMPLFFFISGFLFCLTMPHEKFMATSINKFLRKKAIRLLIPFLFINTLIFIVKSSLTADSSLMQHPVQLNIKSIIDATFLHPMGFMWFLPALFSIFLISFPLFKLLKIKNINGGGYLLSIVLTIIIVIALDIFLPKTSFMQISSAIHYLTYFLLGILYCEYKPSIDCFIRKYWILIGPIFLILSISLTLPKLVSALCGILFSVTFGLILETRCSDKLVKMSGLCYAVFLLSYFPQMFIRGPIAHRFTDVNQYIFSGVSFLLGLFIPICFGLIFLKLKDKYHRLGKFGLLIGL